MKWLLLALAFALFGVGGFLAYKTQAGSALASFGGGTMVLIFAFLSQFKRFKGFGIEAETWEQKMEEAEDTLDRLSDFAIAIAEPLLSASARMGRWSSGLSKRERYELAERIEAALRKTGVGEDAVKKAKTDIYRFDLVDMAQPIAQAINEIMRPVEEAAQQKIQAFPKPITITPDWKAADEHLDKVKEEKSRLQALMKIELYPSLPEELPKVVRSLRTLSDEAKKGFLDDVSDTLADIKHYRDTGTFRDLKAWLKEDEDV